MGAGPRECCGEETFRSQEGGGWGRHAVHMLPAQPWACPALSVLNPEEPPSWHWLHQEE